jgi:hypothetical protein
MTTYINSTVNEITKVKNLIESSKVRDVILSQGEINKFNDTNSIFKFQQYQRQYRKRDNNLFSFSAIIDVLK